VNDEDILEAMQPLGMDPEILQLYNCQPVRVRAVRDVLKVRTPYGPWALKKVHMTPEKLHAVYQLTEHIARSGQFAVPRFIRTRYGDPFVIHPTGLYYMTPWLAGREADLRKPAHFIAATRLMALWHAAAKEFHSFREETSVTLPVAERLDMGSNMLHILVEKGKQKSTYSPFVRMVIASEDELTERIHLAKSRLQETGFAEFEQKCRAYGLACHGRFLKKNILFDGESYSIVNYDHVEIGSQIAELGFYLHRYMPAYEWDSEILEQAVRAYHAEQPFDMLHLDRLSAALSVPFRPLQIISWYQSREIMWQEEDYIDAFELALDLEEARAAAADSLRYLFRLPLVKKSESDKSVIDLASSPEEIKTVPSPREKTSAEMGKRRPGRGKKRPLRTMGPTILNPSRSMFPLQGDNSGSSDEHGYENDEQEHQDK
jgi:CotS family spore coat protein